MPFQVIFCKDTLKAFCFGRLGAGEMRSVFEHCVAHPDFVRTRWLVLCFEPEAQWIPVAAQIRPIAAHLLGARFMNPNFVFRIEGPSGLAQAFYASLQVAADNCLPFVEVSPLSAGTRADGVEGAVGPVAS